MIFPGVARQLLCITEAEVIFPVHVTEMELYASLLRGMRILESGVMAQVDDALSHG